ncbi:hypothetical protein SSABA_v1c01190 [Spiroplasma sabaudiense Ar-1343]|uniref:Uncharacterized protein n=1 Tax=Spiroplasma sabaudiense Ar-1343 TaxID=1276257 RepID=W6A979_9MOLU|nr:hypothetical protein [Spiroplasma sabaudiense]AHI53531.1 hypothetical protein SSABA_v1c01190 [Spiroplasma sabaudiense Ar-1343]
MNEIIHTIIDRAYMIKSEAGALKLSTEAKLYCSSLSLNNLKELSKEDQETTLELIWVWNLVYSYASWYIKFLAAKNLGAIDENLKEKVSKAFEVFTSGENIFHSNQIDFKPHSEMIEAANKFELKLITIS